MEVDIPIDIKPGEPRCPSCYGRDIVHDVRRGMLDRFMARFGREPRHCRFCGRRFYIDLRRSGNPQFDPAPK